MLDNTTTKSSGSNLNSQAKKPEIQKNQGVAHKTNSSSSFFQNKNNKRRPRGRFNKFQKRPQEFEERVVNISRVVNVVKGGRNFSFSTLVVIGDKKGRVGYGHGKAKEVPDSIKKGIKDARKNLIVVPVTKGTIPHIIQAKFISSNVLLKPAPKGRGIIASGAVRAVVELAGYTDIVTKSLGSSNKINVVKAALKALTQLRQPKDIASLRDIDVKTMK